MEATKSRLARGYSRTAPFYDALVGHQYLTGLRRLLPMVKLPPLPAILDIGCGTGLNLLEAARWFGPARLLAGIDLSPGMVAVARSKAAALGIPAVITEGDAEQLPYADGQFDLVICNSVLHWFKDRDRAVSEMRRVLRPGGQLILICASAPGFQEWFGLLDLLLHMAVGPGARNSMPALPTAAEVAGLLQKHGFLVLHGANPIRRQQVLQPESFVRMMSTVAPHWTADLPEDASAMLELALVLLLRRGWPDGFPITWSACEAVAVRGGLTVGSL